MSCFEKSLVGFTAPPTETSCHFRPLKRIRISPANRGTANIEGCHVPVDRMPLPTAPVDRVTANNIVNVTPDEQAIMHGGVPRPASRRFRILIAIVLNIA